MGFGKLGKLKGAAGKFGGAAGSLGGAFGGASEKERLGEMADEFREVLLDEVKRNEFRRASYGIGPRYPAGPPPALTKTGSFLKEPGKHASAVVTLDPSNANMLHMANPRSQEVAMVMAEHARWAQREALKAQYLASSDSLEAAEAANRANAAVMKAMLQKPKANFQVFEEKPLPGLPWYASARSETEPPDPHKMILGGTAGDVDLERLAEWFKKHPRPPKANLANVLRRFRVKDKGVSPRREDEFWPPTRAPAPVPFLTVTDPNLASAGFAAAVGAALCPMLMCCPAQLACARDKAVRAFLCGPKDLAAAL